MAIEQPLALMLGIDPAMQLDCQQRLDLLIGLPVESGFLVGGELSLETNAMLRPEVELAAGIESADEIDRRYEHERARRSVQAAPHDPRTQYAR
jgi:hypothetical protein